MRWSRAHTRNLIILFGACLCYCRKKCRKREKSNENLSVTVYEILTKKEGAEIMASQLSLQFTMLYIFQHNISKFYYCYDYVPSVERYIFQTFIYVRFFLLRLSAACFSFFFFLLLLGLLFCVGKSWNINFPENKCSCSQDSRAQCHSLTSASPLMCCHAITDSKMEWPGVIR